ncbi:MAG: DNA repair protein RecO [Phycisphaeraceae bacterium]|nr:DNA repair protein RecO [Phycisphaeraceae bacterium]
MPLLKDDAVCIRVWDWSETSQTVSLFCRASGLIRAIAKGSKRENSKFSGGLEVLTRGEALASVKNPDTLALLTAWELEETFPAARRSIHTFYAAMACLEIVQRSVTDADPHPGLFDALLHALRSLGTAPEDRDAILGLLWAALVETGHQPELALDVRSQTPLPAAEVYAFFPRLGGLSRDNTDTGGEEIWRIRAETVSLLRTLAAPPAMPRIAPAATPPEAQKRATQLLRTYLRHIIAAETPALDKFIDVAWR